MPALIEGVRIKFTKGEPVKYVSHLDTMKMLERALRRANIRTSLSEGFNPHPHIVIGLPVQVGVTSESEYADIELAAGAPDADALREFTARLGSALPDGVRILAAAPLRTRRNIMGAIAMAEITVKITLHDEAAAEAFPKAVADLMKTKEFVIEQPTKTGTKTFDIRPMIVSLECVPTGPREFKLTMRTDAGSASNLKPEAVTASLRKISGLEFDASDVHRTALWIRGEKDTIDPMSAEALSDIIPV